MAKNDEYCACLGGVECSMCKMERKKLTEPALGAKIEQLDAENAKLRAHLADLVTTAKHYLGPDFGQPEGAGNQVSFMIAAIHRLGAMGQDYTKVAHALTEARAERDRLREALEWLTNVICGVSRDGGPPGMEEQEAVVANAQEVLAAYRAEAASDWDE